MIRVDIKNESDETITSSKHLSQEAAEAWKAQCWPNNDAEYVDTTAEDNLEAGLDYARDSMSMGREIMAFIRAGNESANLGLAATEAIYNNADVDKAMKALRNGNMLYAKHLIGVVDVSIFPTNAKAYLIGKIDEFLIANGKPTEYET